MYYTYILKNHIKGRYYIDLGKAVDEIEMLLRERIDFNLTKEIMEQKGQDDVKVTNLNKKAKVQKERNK